MMKRMFLLALVLLLAVPVAEAGRKKKKAGQLDDSVYTDNGFDFSLTVHENWKARIRKDKDSYRLVLTQKNYGIPPDYQRVPDYTKVPRLAIFADTSTAGVYPFLDSLLSDSYKSDQKKSAMKECEILYESELVPMGRKRAEIGGSSAVIWKGKSKYMKEIQETAGSVAGKRIYGAYGGAIVVTKKDNVIVLFHVMCEWQFYESVMSEVMSIVTSLKWPPEEGEES